MNLNSLVTTTFWAACAGLVAASTIYLGANTEPWQALWPRAGLAGAALGGGAAVALLAVAGNRRGFLLLGMPAGLVIGLGASFFFAGK